MKKIIIGMLLFITLIFLSFNSRVVLAQEGGQSGTTLIAEKTASGSYTKEYGWSINKTVTPSTWDLLGGDSGISQYTIDITKDNGRDIYKVTGEVCVTNGGAVTTENLTIVDQVEYKVGAGQFQDLLGATQTITPEQLLPDQTGCYPYEIEFTPVNGATYRNSAQVTITNHSGSIGEPKGPTPRADFSIPTEPVLINDTVTVADTNGESWEVSESTSINYEKEFICPINVGEHSNTVTILQTGQSSTAVINVNCHGLTISNDVNTFFNRYFDWSINKSADQNELLLAINQSFTVNYDVLVSSGFMDSDFLAKGTINVTNNTPLTAELTEVKVLMSESIPTTVTCEGISFPYLLAPGSSISCSYSTELPDSASRINTAYAVTQNYSYSWNGNTTKTGTSSYAAPANILFENAEIDEIDECVEVTDNLGGYLGQFCTDGVETKNYSYSYEVGPFLECGEQQIINIAELLTNDTQTVASDTWQVNVDVPCDEGCTLTIGYWKNHAGFGPQNDMVTELLPQWLGNENLCSLLGIRFCSNKSVKVDTNVLAVQYLSMKEFGKPSNGITKLYAQLLAAKLNLASGAGSTTVDNIIKEADSFLSQHNYKDWDKLSKQDKSYVLYLMTKLDQFNNGEIGPGHCSM